MCDDAPELGNPCGLCDAGHLVCGPTGEVTCQQPEGFNGDEEPGRAGCGYCDTGIVTCGQGGPVCENEITKAFADGYCQCSESMCQMGTPGVECRSNVMDCGSCRGFACQPVDCAPDRAGESCENCGTIACGGAQGGGDEWICVPNADIGEDCGSCDAFTGSWRCDPDEGMVCEGGTNACGGCEPLEGVIGEACGDCARFRCGDDGAIACVQLPRNACGHCSDEMLALPVYCGVCNQGLERCEDDMPVCDETDTQKPGDRCEGGYLACVDNALICRNSPDGWTAIPAGSYCMGTPADRACRNQEFQEQGFDTERLTPTVITHPFLIMTREVTREMWRAYEPDAAFSNCDCGGDACDDADCPADFMTWFAALDYANWRSRQEGLTECYPSEVAGWAQAPPSGNAAGLAIDAVIANLDLNCDGFRLPTEAEWEYAARAGVTTRSQIQGELLVCEQGSTRAEPVLDPVAWWAATSDAGRMAASGLKPANAWGLFDTLGNASEMVMAQQYASTAEEVPVFDRVWRTRWEPATQRNALVRGGGSNSQAWSVGLGAKRAHPVSANVERVGLRLVRTVPTPPVMRGEQYWTVPTCP